MATIKAKSWAVAYAMLVDDGDDGWLVCFQDGNKRFIGDSAKRFATPGAALDWAIKWATDRRLVLSVDMTDFLVTKDVITTPVRELMSDSEDVYDMGGRGLPE